jgi:voltage-gated potassium channel Kch
MYYSLVTLTTLGYGDFAAATDVGRFLSTTEAVVGQIFLVTFVASLVSMHTGRLAREREASAKQSSDNA